MERRRQTGKWLWSQKSDLEVSSLGFLFATHITHRLSAKEAGNQERLMGTDKNKTKENKKWPNKNLLFLPKTPERGSLPRWKPLENKHSTAAKHHIKNGPHPHTSSKGQLGSLDLHPHQAVRRYPALTPSWYQRRTKRKLGLPFSPGSNKAPHTVPVETMWESWTSTPPGDNETHTPPCWSGVRGGLEQ